MHENLRITTILKVGVEKRPYWSWRVHPGDNPLNKKNLNRILNMNLYTCISTGEWSKERWHFKFPFQ